MRNIKNLNDKSKRIIVIAGCIVLCAVLVVAIASRFQSESKQKGTVSSSSASSSITPLINSNTSSASSAVSTTSPASAAIDQSTQNLQSEVTKPSAPSESETKNPSKPPSGNSTSSNNSSTQTPKPGDKKDGKVYISGFGWVTDTGGSGATVGNSGDQLTGNKVGQMN